MTPDELRTKLEESGDPYLQRLATQLSDEQLARLKELVTGE